MLERTKCKEIIHIVKKYLTPCGNKKEPLFSLFPQGEWKQAMPLILYGHIILGPDSSFILFDSFLIVYSLAIF